MKQIYFIMILYFLMVIRPTLSFGFDYAIFNGILAIGSVLYSNFDRLIGCKMKECCSLSNSRNEWIPVNLRALSHSLDKNLHGQHLVKKIVTGALKAHFSSKDPKKALVLSFHGWTGGGKNFVAKMIAESLYKKGTASQYVHLFVSTIDFPHEDEVDMYKLQIQDWIRGNVSKCEVSLFIFDEIDKMPMGMIDAIKPFIDFHENIFGIDFRKSIFLFLSNTGGREIAFKMHSHWKEGKERTDVTYKDMEELVLKGAFNEMGGLHESSLIEHSLIDYYIPFFPLERGHVELCVKDELIRRDLKPTKELIDRVADEMIYFPPQNRLYSSKGCKSVYSKVSFLVSEKFFDSLDDDEDD